ncbi:MAG: tRNA lysidine(34) synthetase TilS [Verrucomicrobia bacterium]|nr:tRNA lysidine(34) synthetase TilS [Verrucomicrobiota bacterium]
MLRQSPSSWPEIALKLAAAMPLERLHPSALAWVRDGGLASGRRWAAAFSGGADSLALLLLLWAHWPERRDRLVALHFNHRLRGRAAAADAAFCRRVCAGLGITLVAGSWETAFKGASEAEARTARFSFFQRELARRRITALWFGHQQDDIAETFFMRLARGSGTAGLAAPRPVQKMPAGRVHLRPLLTLTKKQVMDSLRQAGAVWREDASNESGDYFRNRIRRDVLPAWRTAAEARNALAGAALSRELLEEDDVALEAWLDALAPLTASGQMDVRGLAGKPRALLRRALHRWLGAQRAPGDLSRQGFEVLLAAVTRGAATRFSLGTSGFAVIRKGFLVFEKPPAFHRSRRRK